MTSKHAQLLAAHVSQGTRCWHCHHRTLKTNARFVCMIPTKLKINCDDRGRVQSLSGSFHGFFHHFSCAMYYIKYNLTHFPNQRGRACLTDFRVYLRHFFNIPLHATISTAPPFAMLRAYGGTLTHSEFDALLTCTPDTTTTTYSWQPTKLITLPDVDHVMKDPVYQPFCPRLHLLTPPITQPPPQHHRYRNSTHYRGDIFQYRDSNKALRVRHSKTKKRSK